MVHIPKKSNKSGLLCREISEEEPQLYYGQDKCPKNAELFKVDNNKSGLNKAFQSLCVCVLFPIYVVKIISAQRDQSQRIRLHASNLTTNSRFTLQLSVHSAAGLYLTKHFTACSHRTCRSMNIM